MVLSAGAWCGSPLLNVWREQGVVVESDKGRWELSARDPIGVFAVLMSTAVATIFAISGLATFPSWLSLVAVLIAFLTLRPGLRALREVRANAIYWLQINTTHLEWGKTGPYAERTRIALTAFRFLLVSIDEDDGVGLEVVTHQGEYLWVPRYFSERFGEEIAQAIEQKGVAVRASRDELGLPNSQ